MRSLGLASVITLTLMAAIAVPCAAQTTPTGDRIDGVAVATRIDATDLTPGQTHRFLLQGPDTALAQHWYMPVVVIKGARPGRRLLVTTGVHGDELNGMAVVHDLMAGVDPATLSGVLIVVPGVNTPGLMAGTRVLATRGVSGADMNRVMPGDAASGDIERRYAAAFWTGVVEGSADALIDIHTQSLGTAYSAFVFVDPRRAGSRRIADLLRPNFIKLDAGEPGTVETEADKIGIDAVTFELGEARVFQNDLIARGVQGIRNVMMDLDMIAGEPTLEGADPFVAPRSTAVRAGHGGFTRRRVELGDDVVEGQTLAVVENAFGDVVQTLTAPVGGRISVIATDPVTEPGGMVVRILSLSDDPACAQGC